MTIHLVMRREVLLQDDMLYGLVTTMPAIGKPLVGGCNCTLPDGITGGKGCGEHNTLLGLRPVNALLSLEPNPQQVVYIHCESGVR